MHLGVVKKGYEESKVKPKWAGITRETVCQVTFIEKSVTFCPLFEEARTCKTSSRIHGDVVNSLLLPNSPESKQRLSGVAEAKEGKRRQKP